MHPIGLLAIETRFSFGELGAIFGIVAGIMTFAAKWLQVQVQNYIDTTNDQVLKEIKAEIKAEYPLKQVTELRLAQIESQQLQHYTDLQRRLLLLETETRHTRPNREEL
jgi:hypothetical protein